MSVKHLTSIDAKAWYQHTDRQIFLGDVLDASNSDTMRLVECIGSIGTTWLGLDPVSFVAPPQHSPRYACVGAPRSRRRSRRHLVPI